VTTEGELIDRSTLPAEVKDTDLGRSCVSGSVASATLTSVPWGRGHHDYTSTWDKAYSCNSGSNEQDGGPLRILYKSERSRSICVRHPGSSEVIHPSPARFFTKNRDKGEWPRERRGKVLTKCAGGLGGWVRMGGGWHF